MAEKREKNPLNELLGGVSELLVGGLFGSIRSAVAGAVETAETYVGNVTRKVAQSVIFAFLALVGLVYVFSGVEDWLNATYNFPGIGGLVVGGALLLAALALYLFSRNNSNR